MAAHSSARIERRGIMGSGWFPTDEEDGQEYFLERDPQWYTSLENRDYPRRYSEENKRNE